MKSIMLDLPVRIETALDEATREEGRSQTEIVAAALEDSLFIRQFRRLREKMTARAQRVFTDEEIFESVS